MSNVLRNPSFYIAAAGGLLAASALAACTSGSAPTAPEHSASSTALPQSVQDQIDHGYPSSDVKKYHVTNVVTNEDGSINVLDVQTTARLGNVLKFDILTFCTNDKDPNDKNLAHLTDLWAGSGAYQAAKTSLNSPECNDRKVTPNEVPEVLALFASMYK